MTPDLEPASRAPFFSFVGLLAASLVFISLFLVLGKDFKSGSDYFIRRYRFVVDAAEVMKKTGDASETLNRENPNSPEHTTASAPAAPESTDAPPFREIIIGNSKKDSHITIADTDAGNAHLKLTLMPDNFVVRNISRGKKVDINGKYLNKPTLQEGDRVILNGKDTIRVVRINKQYPLGRSIKLAIGKNVAAGEVNKEHFVTLYTLLNKTVMIKYARTGEILTGLNELILPGKRPGGAAVLSYEPKRYFLGMNIYYIIVFLAVLLLSSGIYLYLKNRFSGALLLLMMVSLSFFSGVVPPSTQIVTAGCFIPFIIFGFIRKRGKIRGGWLVVIIFAAIFTFPEMLRMDGSFTIQYFNAGKHSISIAKKSGSFQLEDGGQTLAYNQPHRIILGHTSYRLLVSPKEIILEPMDPGKIKAAPDFNGIISDTNLVKPGSNYIYLKYPHHFPLVTAAKAAGQKSLVVNDKKGNFLVMTKSGNRNYNSYRLGLILFIIVPFWLFLGVDLYGIPIPFSRFKKPVFRMGLLNADNAVIFHLVYFMLGLGYVIFGALALYNTGMWDNFQKYRSQGLPLFVGLFFASLVLSRYNRWLIFLYRVTIQKRFHVPFLIAVLLVLPLNYSKYFLYGGILYFILLFFFRLRKEIVYEYKNASSYPLNLKAVIEKPISDFEESGNRRIFFGLGKVLYNKGWNYLLVSDLLLMLALFFIVLQIFLGSELGVSVGG
ncbi:MAG: hypothetical protein GY765_36470, partial [bacterium]|nr:hypothetical protein [bacterium]